MIDNTSAEFIFCALRIGPLIALVALIALAFRKRLMFAMGFAGCFVGLLFDRGGSTGGHLDHAATRADSFLIFGIIGATIGLLTAYVITLQQKRNKKPITSTSPDR